MTTKRTWIQLVATYTGTRVMLFAIILFSMAAIPIRAGSDTLFASGENALLDGLVRFDSWWYHNLVTRGYSIAEGQSNVAFFPLYPWLIRLVSTITDNLFISGVLISNIAFFATLYFVHRWATIDHDEQTANRAIYYLAIAPAAVFTAAMYTESLFMALVAACFYYARTQRFFLAAVMGLLAAMTRNIGILMAGVIALEYWQQIYQGDGETLGHWLWGLLPASLVSVGLLVHAALLFDLFGDPFLFVTVQASWGREVLVSNSNPLLIISNARRLLDWGTNGWAAHFNAYIIIDSVMTVLGLGLSALLAFRGRWSYAFFCIATLLIPLSTGTVISMSRYVIVLLPIFIMLAQLGSRERVDRIITTVSLPLFAYNAILFSHWYFTG